MKSIFSLFQFGCIAFVSAMLVWFLCFEPPFLSYPNIPFPAHVERAMPGDTVPLTVTRCSIANGERLYVTTHVLVNLSTGEEAILPPSTVSIMPGCLTVRSEVNYVPMGTRPGRYYFRGTAKVDGAIRIFYLTWRSTVFQVGA